MARAPSHTEIAHIDRDDVLAQAVAGDRELQSRIGEVVGLIAYEINQPLAAIVVNSETSIQCLSREPPDLNEVRTLIFRMARDAHRAAAIVANIHSDMCTLASGLSTIEINEVIIEAISSLRGEIQQHSVEISLALASGLPAIDADRVQLRQVIIHIMLDAMHAMNEVGAAQRRLIIRTSLADKDSLRTEIEHNYTGSKITTGSLGESFVISEPNSVANYRSAIESYGGKIGATNKIESGNMQYWFTLSTTAGPEALPK